MRLMRSFDSLKTSYPVLCGRSDADDCATPGIRSLFQLNEQLGRFHVPIDKNFVEKVESSIGARPKVVKRKLARKLGFPIALVLSFVDQCPLKGFWHS